MYPPGPALPHDVIEGPAPDGDDVTSAENDVTTSGEAEDEAGTGDDVIYENIWALQNRATPPATQGKGIRASRSSSKSRAPPPVVRQQVQGQAAAQGRGGVKAGQAAPAWQPCSESEDSALPAELLSTGSEDSDHSVEIVI